MARYSIAGAEYADFETFGRRCGCSRPSYLERRQVDGRLADFRAANGAFRAIAGKIHIPVQFIHLTDGVTGTVTAEQRGDQVGALNAAYGPHDFTFSYEEPDTKTLDNSDWFRMGHKSAAERLAKATLQADPENTLNLYTTSGGGTLGWATFPWELEGDPVRDGVVVAYTTLPRAGPPPFNLGATATHEVGHWLGLYHTFQGGCGATGDHVGDTAAHGGPNFGKPEQGLRHNACDPKQQAPVKNYMNYVDDEWMEEFSPRQATRMRDMVGAFRPELLQNVSSDPSLRAACTRVSRVL